MPETTRIPNEDEPQSWLRQSIERIKLKPLHILLGLLLSAVFFWLVLVRTSSLAHSLG